MTINPYISRLNQLGQSIWYDNLSRDVLRSGELSALVDAGVSGLTSNPTIFKQAIADTADYDRDLSGEGLRGMSAEKVCESLMVEDVARAADLLRPVYLNSHGADGHASIEVSPYLAHDTAGTVEAARRLWGRLDRPNIMIKVPATPEGLPAVQQLLRDGINVNVTLIFSAAVYCRVAEAYLTALEARQAGGLGLGEVASVASFFVSRVDAICEKKFDELVAAGKQPAEKRELFFGKVGVANSKLAYAEFGRLFGGPRFQELARAGARVQRPLWASTGTKNPKLKPVLYVEELAGRDTVNTVPPATLKALLKGAEIEDRLQGGLNEARRVISGLGDMGLDFEGLLADLQTAGVKSFADSYRDLVSAVEAKRRAVQHG